MAHSVRRVPVTGVRPDSALYWAWKSINALIGLFDGHVHGGVTAGGGSTTLPNGTPFPLGPIANMETRSPDTGAPISLTGNLQGPYLVRPSARSGSFLAALIETFNALIDEVDGHTHGGVTAGGAATAAWLADSTVAKIADQDGRDYVTGALVSAANGAVVKHVVTGRGFADDLIELCAQLNNLIAFAAGHTHNATAGAASTAGFALSSACAKIADMEGRGPDGEVVT